MPGAQNSKSAFSSCPASFSPCSPLDSPDLGFLLGTLRVLIAWEATRPWRGRTENKNPLNPTILSLLAVTISSSSSQSRAARLPGGFKAYPGCLAAWLPLGTGAESIISSVTKPQAYGTYLADPSHPVCLNAARNDDMRYAAFPSDHPCTSAGAW